MSSIDEATLYNLYSNSSSNNKEITELLESLLNYLKIKPVKLRTKKGYRFIKLKGKNDKTI